MKSILILGILFSATCFGGNQFPLGTHSGAIITGCKVSRIAIQRNTLSTYFFKNCRVSGIYSKTPSTLSKNLDQILSAQGSLSLQLTAAVIGNAMQGEIDAARYFTINEEARLLQMAFQNDLEVELRADVKVDLLEKNEAQLSLKKMNMVILEK